VRECSLMILLHRYWDVSLSVSVLGFYAGFISGFTARILCEAGGLGFHSMDPLYKSYFSKLNSKSRGR